MQVNQGDSGIAGKRRQHVLSRLSNIQGSLRLSAFAMACVSRRGILNEFDPFGGCGWFHACVVSGVMDLSPQIEPTSTASLLTSLSFAIDEIKLIKSINNLTVMIDQLELEKPSSHRLLFQKREISILQSRLAKTRSKASRIKTVIKLPKFK